MAALIDTIKRTHAPAIFLDVSENQNLARQIASSTGAKVVTDLYVEALSAPSGPAPTYLDMIRHDVEDIVNALKEGGQFPSRLPAPTHFPLTLAE